MNRRGFRDDAPPWSFFLPVTLAVVLGVLIADAIRLAVGAIFVRERDAVIAPAKAPSPRAIVSPEEASAPSAQAEPVQATASDTPAARPSTQDESPAQIEASELPGPISAIRDRDAQACINGTIAERRPNGWEQSLENDAPVRCTAVSP